MQEQKCLNEEEPNSKEQFGWMLVNILFIIIIVTALYIKLKSLKKCPRYKVTPKVPNIKIKVSSISEDLHLTKALRISLRLYGKKMCNRQGFWSFLYQSVTNY